MNSKRKVATYTFMFMLFCFFALVYVSLMLFFWVGLLRMRQTHIVPHPMPSLSVVIPVHNEEEYLEMTIKSIAQQSYSGSYEVIWVNDRSTDSSAIILDRACAQHDRFRVLHLDPSLPSVPSPKKRALQMGFAEAKNEIFMTTDGDCLPDSLWMESMTANFSKNVGIVQGTKAILPKDSFLHKLQQLDTMGFTLMEGSFFTWQKPMLASAPSLAYRSSLYHEVGGFASLMDLVSGDDDMLVHKMWQQGWQVRYNLDPKAIVYTHGASSWKELFVQRARWASNGSEYDSWLYIGVLLGVYLFFVTLLVSPLTWVLGWVSGTQVLCLWGCKFLVDGLMMITGAYKLKSLSFLKYFFPMEIVQVLLVVWAAPAGHFKWYSWK